MIGMSKMVVLLFGVLLLVSCGYDSRSTLHSGKAWKAYKGEPPVALGDVSVKMGERVLAYRHRVGYPPMFGGFVPTLLAEDAGLVKVELVNQTRGHDTYLTPLKAGTTRIHLVNGLIDEKENRERIGSDTFLYRVRVLP